MRRLYSVFLGVAVAVMCAGSAFAASDQAMKLRNRSDLTPYTPPDAFLSGNFVADEDNPGFIFGKVKDFVSTRSCPTSWLIEEGERNRIQGLDPKSGPVEYTLYLEEDCPGKIVYYVFVDQSQANTAQWLEWRKRFHKNKAEQQYGAAKASLDRASENGFPVDGELRFVEVNGDLALKQPEQILTGDLKFQPLYDITQGKAISR